MDALQCFGGPAPDLPAETFDIGPQSATDFAPLMVRITDATGACTWVNARWREFTGADETTAAGDGWLACVHPNDRRRARAQLLEARGRGAFNCLEHRMLAADGGIRWVLCAVTPRFAADGSFLGCLASVVDVSDHHQTEARLRASEARLTAIFDAAPDAMVVCDAAGRIETFSPEAERLFGYAAREVAGAPFELLAPGERAGAVARAGRRDRKRRILAARRKDGVDFPIELSIGEGEVAGRRILVGFIHDISARRAQETRADSLQAELVHVSRLNAMGQMASTLAHELNQPLAAASNYVEAGRRLLDAGRGDARAAQAALTAAADEIERAGQIIRRLREFVARGRTERRVQGLRRVVEEATALALVGGRGGRSGLTMRLDPSAPWARIDRIQIQQVVLNLVRNGLEAIDGRSGAELAVSLERSEAGEPRISVADTGPGLSPEIQAKLFTPFASTKRDGLGVGLSICRTIVEAHGGRIWAEPRPGGGAVFRFTLPAAEARRRHGP